MKKSDQKILAFIAFSIIWCWLWYEAIIFGIEKYEHLKVEIHPETHDQLLSYLDEINDDYDFSYIDHPGFYGTPYRNQLYFRKNIDKNYWHLINISAVYKDKNKLWGYRRIDWIFEVNCAKAKYRSADIGELMISGIYDSGEMTITEDKLGSAIETVPSQKWESLETWRQPTSGANGAFIAACTSKFYPSRSVQDFLTELKAFKPRD